MTGRFSQLLRLRLSASVALTALAGYLLYPRHEGAAGALYLFAGVLLLVAGSSACNQVQERHVDALMERTRNRPLPTGRLTPAFALAISLLLLIAGLLLIYRLAPTPAALLGLASVLCYNGVYTPLKKRTCFALIPGALCGAAPPMIGWLAAGGQAGDHRIVLLAGLFFLWQMPHFWLLSLRHGNDLKRAGLPALHDRIGRRRTGRIVLLWVAALAVASGLGLLLDLLSHPLLKPLSALALLWLLTTAAGTFLKEERMERLGPRLNVYMAVLLTCLLLDGILVGA